jgi:hypothetical protein
MMPAAQEGSRDDLPDGLFGDEPGSTKKPRDILTNVSERIYSTELMG